MKYFLYKCVIHVTNNLILNLIMLHCYCYVLLTDFFSIETEMLFQKHTFLVTSAFLNAEALFTFIEI